MNQILPAILIVGGIGLIFGCILAFASVIFAVQTDEREEQVLEVLPGANCGACGFAGCSAYAAAVAKGEAGVGCCSVGKAPVAAKIAEIMGVAAENAAPKTAKVFCGGTCENASQKFEYVGIQDCIAANKVAGGAKTCAYGCLGLGTCAKVCPFGAISVQDGVAVVDEEKCVACGKCVAICPKHVIRIVPAGKKVHVLCSSGDAGTAVNKACKTGCIGCRICEKNCPKEAVRVENNLAAIDYEKCVGCGICAAKCPKKAITGRREQREE